MSLSMNKKEYLEMKEAVRTATAIMGMTGMRQKQMISKTQPIKYKMLHQKINLTSHSELILSEISELKKDGYLTQRSIKEKRPTLKFLNAREFFHLLVELQGKNLLCIKTVSVDGALNAGESKIKISEFGCLYLDFLYMQKENATLSSFVRKTRKAIKKLEKVCAYSLTLGTFWD